MKVTAAVLVEPRRIELQEFPLPDIGDDDGLLRVESCGVCGADWLPYTGEFLGGMFKPPLILGHEIVGRIARIGDAAARRWGVREGDRVILEEPIPCGNCAACRVGRFQACGADRYGTKPVASPPSLWGGYSDYVYLAPAAIMHKIPEEIPVELAPLFVPLSNGAYWVEEIGGLHLGQTVVIQGPGQHGLGCVIAAKEAGAGCVIVTGLAASDQHRLEVATALGADHVICVDEEDGVRRVAEITDGEMAHVVVQVAERAPAAFNSSVHLAADRGTIVNIGTVIGPADGFEPDAIIFKELTIKGARGRYDTAIKAAIHLLSSGKYPLELLATHTFPIAETDTALRTVGREAGEDSIHVTVIADGD